MGMRLDYNMVMPSGMDEYISMYGWHFSKKMCEWACSRMYRLVNNKKEYINPYTKDWLMQLLRNWSVSIDDTFIYDSLYIANMCKADFFGSGIADDQRLAYYVGDVINDPDGYDGMVFTRFYADCIGSGTPINWEDLI